MRTPELSTVKHLLLIRHGQTEYNRLHRVQGRGINAPLNETGFRQALRVAEAVAPYKPDAVYSSSLLRARQTAETIVSHIGMDSKKFPRPHCDLDEMDFGVLEGELVEDKSSDLYELVTSWKSGDIQLAAESGESPVQVYERANRQIFSILHAPDHKDHSVFVFVLHGRLIRVLLSQWLGYGLQGMHLIPHHNAGLNYVKWVPGEGVSVSPTTEEDPLLGTGSVESVFINQIDHLDEESLRSDSAPSEAAKVKKPDYQKSL